MKLWWLVFMKSLCLACWWLQYLTPDGVWVNVAEWCSKMSEPWPDPLHCKGSAHFEEQKKICSHLSDICCMHLFCPVSVFDSSSCVGWYCWLVFTSWMQHQTWPWSAIGCESVCVVPAKAILCVGRELFIAPAWPWASIPEQNTSG